MRTCSTCRETKPLDEFGWRNKAENTRVYKCKPCQREYTNASYRANREKRIRQLAASNASRRIELRRLVLEIKSESGCTDCDEVDPIVLEFDHLRDKKFNISSAVSQGNVGVRRLLAEIEKCEVVCANCHRRRTHARRQIILENESDRI